MIKMQPSESIIYPDLVLTVPAAMTVTYKQLLKSLSKGDEIRFTGKFIALGNEFKMHHMELYEVEGLEALYKTGKSKNLNDIVVRESTIPN